jgi:hypothetical protein
MVIPMHADPLMRVFAFIAQSYVELTQDEAALTMAWQRLIRQGICLRNKKPQLLQVGAFAFSTADHYNVG